MSCYACNIILELLIFWLKYIGFGTVRRTTKLIEGGHLGLQANRPICYYFYVFYVFFKIQKVVTFYVFFAMSRTFSRTGYGWPVALLYGSASDQQSTNDRKVAGSRPTKLSKVVCIKVLTGNRMGWTARCGRPPLLPSCRKLEFRLSVDGLGSGMYKW